MKINETVREDGLRIITGKVPSKKVFVQMIAGVGSAYDPEGKDGLFHYFEHMAFKGSGRRNINEIRDFARKNILQSNASTGRLQTEFHGEAVRHKFSLLCDYICDIFFNSIYPADEVEREKEVVFNEIARDWDQDNYAVYFLLWENLWEKNPMRIFGVGSPDGVKSITRENLLEAKQKWYVPSNTLAIGIGPIEHEKFVEEINQRVPLNHSKTEHLSWADEYLILPKNKEVVLLRPKREKATLVYGCKFPMFKEEKANAVLQVLEYTLVKGSASLLWNEIREKRGLAYTVSGGVGGSYPLALDFTVYSEMLPNRVDEVRELINKFVHKNLEHNCSFEDTKEYLYDWYSLSTENLNPGANFISEKNKFGEPVKLAERQFQRYCNLIKSVTFDNVEDMRSELLKQEKFVTVVIKPS